MSSEGSVSSNGSGIRQFGLYRTIDARTEDFLKSSRKRQIRQGCACAAISTAITVTVVVSVILVYEYSINSGTNVSKKTSVKPNWIGLMNDSDITAISSKFNKKINFDRTTLKLLPILLKALNKNRYLEKILEEYSSSPPYTATDSTEATFTRNIFSDSKNWLKFPTTRHYSTDYKTSPLMQWRTPTQRLEYLTKIRKIRDYQRMLNYFDKMINDKVGIYQKREFEYTESPLTAETIPMTKTDRYKNIQRLRNGADVRKDYENIQVCNCPKKLGLLLSKLIGALQDLIPHIIGNKIGINIPCKNKTKNLQTLNEVTTVRTKRPMKHRINDIFSTIALPPTRKTTKARARPAVTLTSRKCCTTSSNGVERKCCNSGTRSKPKSTATRTTPSTTTQTTTSTTTEVTTAEVTTTEVTTAEVTPAEVTTTEVTPAEVTPIEVTPAEVTPAEVTPAEVTPAEVTPAEVTPAEVTPAEVTPAEVTPVEVTPAEVTPVEVTPAEVTPVEVTPAEVTPVEVTPAEVTPPESTPDEVTPCQVIPNEVETTMAPAYNRMRNHHIYADNLIQASTKQPVTVRYYRIFEESTTNYNPSTEPTEPPHTQPTKRVEVNSRTTEKIVTAKVITEPSTDKWLKPYSEDSLFPRRIVPVFKEDDYDEYFNNKPGKMINEFENLDVHSAESLPKTKTTISLEDNIGLNKGDKKTNTKETLEYSNPYHTGSMQDDVDLTSMRKLADMVYLPQEETAKVWRYTLEPEATTPSQAQYKYPEGFKAISVVTNSMENLLTPTTSVVYINPIETSVDPTTNNIVTNSIETSFDPTTSVTYPSLLKETHSTDPVPYVKNDHYEAPSKYPTNSLIQSEQQLLADNIGDDDFVEEYIRPTESTRTPYKYKDSTKRTETTTENPSTWDLMKNEEKTGNISSKSMLPALRPIYLEIQRNNEWKDEHDYDTYNFNHNLFDIPNMN